MQLHHHSLISILGAGAVYLLTRSLPAAGAFFFAGVFIDLDHFFEYFHRFGFRGISVKKFFRAAHRHEYRQYFLFLHSYELAFGLWMAAFFWIRMDWALAFAAGFTIHLFADQIYNPCAPYTYFLGFRIRHKFDGDILFPPELRRKYDRRRKGKVEEGRGER